MGTDMKRFLFALFILMQPAIALAAPDEIYVDPAIAANSGTGTIGDPYGDVQYALDQCNHGGDGARFNVKAGTAEVLAAGGLSLDTHFATNGAPLVTEPLIIEGYTSAAGDGGIAEFTGTANSAAFWVDTTTGGADADYVTFKNLKITTAQASGYAINFDNFNTVINVELISNHGGIDIDTGIINGCKISYVDSAGILGLDRVTVTNNLLTQTSGAFVKAISDSNYAVGNIINVRSGTDAVQTIINTASNNIHAVVANNTILANISSGASQTVGIRVNNPCMLVANNYIEGLNSASDEAINVASSSVGSILANNAFYNNTANVTNNGLATSSIGSTSSLGSSGVTSASGADYTPTAGLQGAGYPTGFLQLSGNATDPDIGAIQIAPSGGSNVIDPLTGTIPGL